MSAVDKPPVPYIYGARGEEWQADPDEPRQSRVWFWIAASIVAIALAVVWL